MATKIGVIADAHCHAEGGSDLPDAVLAAFAGCDLIVPVGDMGESPALDRLESVAPVMVTIGQDDTKTDDRIVAGARVIERDGVVIGVVFQLATDESGITVEDGAPIFPDRPTTELLTAVFGRRVDVVFWGATHRANVTRHDGVLFVNPGSPTYSEFGTTVAVVTIKAGAASAESIPVG
jgi:hypothetical protein